MKKREQEKNTREDAREKATRFFLCHHGLVRLTAFEMVPDESLLEDIVNDVYIRFVQNADRWDYQYVKALLKEITRNVAMDYWRKRARNMPESLRKIALFLKQDMACSQDTENELEQDRLSALESCIKRLTPKSRFLVEEFYMKEKKILAIAEEQNENVSAMKTRLFRIRGVLRKCIDRFLSEGPIDE